MDVERLVAGKVPQKLWQLGIIDTTGTTTITTANLHVSLFYLLKTMQVSWL